MNPTLNDIILDPEDRHFLNEHNWYITKDGYTYYVRAKIDGETVALHRLLTQATNNLEVDHENRNGLDNRKANLRICTRSLNAANRIKYRGSSKYKGVHLKGKRWYAGIRQNGKSFHLGTFEIEEEAALAYNVAASLRFGAFARLNVVSPR